MEVSDEIHYCRERDNEVFRRLVETENRQLTYKILIVHSKHVEFVCVTKKTNF